MSLFKSKAQKLIEAEEEKAKDADWEAMMASISTPIPLPIYPVAPPSGRTGVPEAKYNVKSTRGSDLLDLFECQTCGALIRAAKVEHHFEYHENLNDWIDL